MGVYLVWNLVFLLCPFPWLTILFLPLGFLGIYSRIHWISWLGGLKGFWLFILAGPLFGFPWGEPLNLGNPVFWYQWLPSWEKSLIFLGILASSHWLTATTTILEIQSGLETLLQPFGSKIQKTLGLLGSLTLAFLPWTGEQVRKAQEALELRGLDKKRHPIKYIQSLGLPITIGLLEKSRHTAEALALRNSQENSDLF